MNGAATVPKKRKSARTITTALIGISHPLLAGVTKPNQLPCAEDFSWASLKDSVAASAKAAGLSAKHLWVVERAAAAVTGERVDERRRDGA
jgi:hypothetical protein